VQVINSSKFWADFWHLAGEKIKSLLLTQRIFFENLLDFEDSFFELAIFRQ
jgi:hypothetical protein